MSEQRLNVLIIEDNPGDVYLIRKMLTAIAPSVFTLETADRLAQGLARLAVPGVDVVLLDLSLPDSCGLETFTRARAQAPQIPIVVLSGSGDESLAIQAVHAGAQDYLVKGQVDQNLLARALRYAVERGRVEQERADLLAREQAARAEAEAAVYARDELLAFVAHDLKNPLATIEGYSQLLSQRIARLGLPESERLVADLRKIEAAAKQMTTLIDELLDFNRLQAGLPLDLDRYPTDLVPLVRHLVAEKQQAALHHRFTLEVAAPALVGLWDADRLERVLANLLANAVKYSPAGGKITVVVKEEGHWAIVAVHDEGIGIPAADLPHIFERFHRASNVPGQVEGTGIGLASAYQIVAQHGGAITVTSTEGAGSIFTVRLPLH